MKLRQPDIEAPRLNQKEIGWQRYKFTLLTPLYGGGMVAGEPDKEMPVRAASIRGQLRFWWRLLNRKKYPGSKKLFEAERKIWGGLGDGGNGYASQVHVRIREHHRIKPSIIEADVSKANKLPRYALVPLLGNGRSQLLQNLEFTLEIACPDTLQKEIKDVLRWWMTFGGLGGRTRRGFGSVTSDELSPIDEKEAQKAGCRLIIDRKSVSTRAVHAWQETVTRLKWFRQEKGIGRNAPHPDSKSPAGRSRWPEPDSIREITKSNAKQHPPEHEARPAFPRAAFGLPIIFHFIGRGEPEDTTLKPKAHERLASPLILTAYKLESGQFAPAALRLPTDHLKDLSLELTWEEGSREVSRELWWPSDHNEACAKAKRIKPMQNRGCDALEAFLDFFAKGGK
ncbi:MAG: type III-B CRISPR module RAMP protein Cmr1 [Methylohalobius crimeensis]